MCSPVDCYPVATKSVGKEARHTADGGNADPGEIMNLAVGEALFQQFHNLPPVN